MVTAVLFVRVGLLVLSTLAGVGIFSIGGYLM